MADTIQALDRALELLIYLNKQGREAGITQIVFDMGIYKSTAFHILSTLGVRGFASKNPETEEYRLGSQLLVLGKSVGSKMGIQEVIWPHARRLRQKHYEVANASILGHNPGDVYYSVAILKGMSDQQFLTVSPSVGSLSECHCSAVGKRLLVFGDNIDRAPYEEWELTRYTVNTTLSYEDLKEEINKVRRRGHAMDHEEQETGLICIGAPILDHNKKAVAAISLSGPINRMNSSDLENRIEAVCDTTRDISGNL